MSARPHLDQARAETGLSRHRNGRTPGDSLRPTVEPSTPNGTALAGFPVVQSGPLTLNAALTSESGKTITLCSWTAMPAR